MRIIWREQAELELDASFAFLIEENPGAAFRIYETVRQRVEQLSTQPGLGRPGRVANTRELVITGTPYIVAYRVDPAAEVVIILRVIHGARRWPQELS